MELDWHLFGLAVELQLDPDLDPLILSPAWRGLKLVELTTATVHCTTSFTPPPFFSECCEFKFGTRIQPRLIVTNCTQ